MFAQPHKEERFMFPVYPMICLAGAITVDVIQKLWFFFKTYLMPLKKTAHYLQGTIHIMVAAILICGLLGISRSFALYKGYYAPMDIMMEANKLSGEGIVPDDAHVNFCVGKEWYRFSGSFFFPSNK